MTEECVMHRAYEGPRFFRHVDLEPSKAFPYFESDPDGFESKDGISVPNHSAALEPPPARESRSGVLELTTSPTERERFLSFFSFIPLFSSPFLSLSVFEISSRNRLMTRYF